MFKKTLIIITPLLLLIALIFFIVVFTAGNQKGDTKDTASPTIVASNFISFDLARAITEDTGANVSLLTKPGTDIHSFEPTPQDIIAIKNANLFIYNGGESEAWVDKILEDNEIDKEKTIRLMDFVELKTEEAVNDEEAEDDDGEEYDEHIWTSPKNTISLAGNIRDRLVKLYPDKADEYTNNANRYISELSRIDQKIRNIVSGSARKELIFADRFPFRYFTDEYSLEYLAAFPGCAEQTEASSATVAALIDKVRADNIPVILKIELSSGALAETIAAETGAKILELNSAHNISAEDFENGVSFIDIMKNNLSVLEEALK